MRWRPHFRRPPTVSAADTMRLLESGAAIIDVRGPREFHRRHIPGALHVPLSVLEQRAPELPDDRLLITFCMGGFISSGAASLLIELGFTAASMSGGLSGWRDAGGVLSSTPQEENG